MNTRNTLYVDEKNGHLIIGGVDTTHLAKKYSTPLYVFDTQHIENVANAFNNTIKQHYNGYGKVLYASKAFSTVAIYKLISKLGLGADVVSMGELYTALKAEVSPKDLVMHGNNKTDEELEFAIKNGVGVIVVDSLAELDDIDALCNKFCVQQNIMLRVNPGVEAHTHEFIQTANIDSKFGFSISNGDAFSAVEYAIKAKNCKLVGLHCHIGSQIFEKEAFCLAVNKMTDFYKEIKEKLSYEFDALNMGGGYGIYYTEEDVKLTPNDYAEYVQKLIKTLNNDIETKGLKKPYLYIEPGRSIVGEAGITLYTVGRTKEIKGIKNYLAIDGGMSDNPRFALYDAKYEAILANKGLIEPTKTYTIAGKCCESGDIIAENQLLPEAEKGDILAVFSTGAYNYSMSSNYNKNLTPAVVAVKDSQDEVWVKRQTLDDLIRNEIL